MSFCLGHSGNPTPSEVRWVWLCILVIIVLIANRAFGQVADNSHLKQGYDNETIIKELK